MPRARKDRQSALGPDQDPFITDADMPAGSLDAAASRSPAGPVVRHVFVVTTPDGGGQPVPRAAFTTAAAAGEAAGRFPETAQVHGLVLFSSADHWPRTGDL